jgi:hypothetical protein
MENMVVPPFSNKPQIFPVLSCAGYVPTEFYIMLQNHIKEREDPLSMVRNSVSKTMILGM